MAQLLRDELRLPTGPVDLAARDSRATPGFDGGKREARTRMAGVAEQLAQLQERLFANGRSGTGTTSVLLVLQGMDTSGKGGIVKHVVGLVDPQGIAITSFKSPSQAELAHDFLWRIGTALPASGMIGIFDRSHYEDVLIARVRHLAAAGEIERRYRAINDFEAAYVDSGGTLIKCFLHITADDQEERLLARLNDPTKFWKYNPGDIAERALWADYQRAYELALEHCSTPAAPWFLIPSGRKWYRNWAVAQLLLEHLMALGLQWPAATFDLDTEKRRLGSA